MLICLFFSEGTEVPTTKSGNISNATSEPTGTNAQGNSASKLYCSTICD